MGSFGVLRDRMKVPATTVEEIDDLLRAHEVIAKPHKRLALGIRDPADEWVLASAVAAKADALVTGDRDLHAIAERSPIRIVTPRELWDLLC